MKPTGFEPSAAVSATFGGGMTTSWSSSSATIPSCSCATSAAPYAANWDYLEVLPLIPESGVVPFVVTTANRRGLEKAVESTDAIEITGTTEDFEAVTAAIASAHDI